MGKKRKLQSSYFLFSKKSVLNKYVIVTGAFLIWMLFFDNSSFPANYRLEKNIDHLEAVKAALEKQIVEAKDVRMAIEENKEKYAREKFLMHKDNEDVIVIEKKKK